MKPEILSFSKVETFGCPMKALWALVDGNHFYFGWKPNILVSHFGGLFLSVPWALE